MWRAMTAIENERLAQVAIEVWRLEQRLDVTELSRDRLQDSVRRLTAALSDAGVRFLDPTGHSYTDGMNAEVVAMDADDASAEPPTPPSAEAADATNAMIIKQVLRPSIFVDDVCVVAPQIVVGRATTGERG